MKVQDIINARGPVEVLTIQEDQTILEVVKILVEKNIGALLVRNSKGELVGIISERDILRKGFINCEKLKELAVKDAMTRDLIVSEPEDDIHYVEQMMIKNSIRHIPVISGRKLVAILSIRDIVRAHLDDARYENRYLKDYIEGKYPA